MHRGRHSRRPQCLPNAVYTPAVLYDATYPWQVPPPPPPQSSQPQSPTDAITGDEDCNYNSPLCQKSPKPPSTFVLEGVPFLESPQWSSDDEVENPEFNRHFRHQQNDIICERLRQKREAEKVKAMMPSHILSPNPQINGGAVSQNTTPTYCNQPPFSPAHYASPPPPLLHLQQQRHHYMMDKGNNNNNNHNGNNAPYSHFAAAMDIASPLSNRDGLIGAAGGGVGGAFHYQQQQHEIPGENAVHASLPTFRPANTSTVNAAAAARGSVGRRENGLSHHNGGYGDTYNNNDSKNGEADGDGDANTGNPSASAYRKPGDQYERGYFEDEDRDYEIHGYVGFDGNAQSLYFLGGPDPANVSERSNSTTDTRQSNTHHLPARLTHVSARGEERGDDHIEEGLHSASSHFALSREIGSGKKEGGGGGGRPAYDSWKHVKELKQRRSQHQSGVAHRTITQHMSGYVVDTRFFKFLRGFSTDTSNDSSSSPSSSSSSGTDMHEGGQYVMFEIAHSPSVSSASSLSVFSIEQDARGSSTTPPVRPSVDKELPISFSMFDGFLPGVTMRSSQQESGRHRDGRPQPQRQKELPPPSRGRLPEQSSSSKIPDTVLPSPMPAVALKGVVKKPVSPLNTDMHLLVSTHDIKDGPPPLPWPPNMISRKVEPRKLMKVGTLPTYNMFRSPTVDGSNHDSNGMANIRAGAKTTTTTTTTTTTITLGSKASSAIGGESPVQNSLTIFMTPQGRRRTSAAALPLQNRSPVANAMEAALDASPFTINLNANGALRDHRKRELTHHDQQAIPLALTSPGVCGDLAKSLPHRRLSLLQSARLNSNYLAYIDALAVHEFSHNGGTRNTASTTVSRESSIYMTTTTDTQRGGGGGGGGRARGAGGARGSKIPANRFLSSGSGVNEKPPCIVAANRHPFLDHRQSFFPNESDAALQSVDGGRDRELEKKYTMTSRPLLGYDKQRSARDNRRYGLPLPSTTIASGQHSDVRSDGVRVRHGEASNNQTAHTKAAAQVASKLSRSNNNQADVCDDDGARGGGGGDGGGGDGDGGGGGAGTVDVAAYQQQRELTRDTNGRPRGTRTHARKICVKPVMVSHPHYGDYQSESELQHVQSHPRSGHHAQWISPAGSLKNGNTALSAVTVVPRNASYDPFRRGRGGGGDDFRTGPYVMRERNNSTAMTTPQPRFSLPSHGLKGNSSSAGGGVRLGVSVLSLASSDGGRSYASRAKTTIPGDDFPLPKRRSTAKKHSSSGARRSGSSSPVHSRRHEAPRDVYFTLPAVVGNPRML